MKPVPKPVKQPKKKKRKKGRSERSKLTTYIDQYDSDFCLMINNYECIMCGGHANQTHHYFLKSSHGNVRFNRDNHCAVDFACHRRRIHDACEVEELRDKLIAKIGLGSFDELKSLAYLVADFSEKDLMDMLQKKKVEMAILAEIYPERVSLMSDAGRKRLEAAKNYKQSLG